MTVAPIDIRSVVAGITLDTALETGEAEATMVFRTGPGDAHPAFDLRQTILSAELDGDALDPADDLPLLAVGEGRTSGRMRVITTPVAPCAEHTLVIGYDLGVPAVPGGVGPEYVDDGITWSVASQDIGPGARFVEQWVPANLIYDRYAMSLELRLDGTTRQHTFAANGDVTQVAPQHWRVSFPEQSTASWFQFLLAPSDELDSHTEALTLPDGMTVNVEAYAKTEWAIDLPAQVAVVAGVMDEAVMTVGSYAHGERFLLAYVRPTAFSMEHAGGTEIRPSEDVTLRHEVYHSWWARGLDPISQIDGWIDEGWTVYTINREGNVPPLPDDEDPRRIVDDDLWARYPVSSEIGSYDFYAAVFGTLADRIGAEALDGLMADLWNEAVPGFMSTADLERFLYCESGDEQVRFVFHRWVYGEEGEPAPPPDDLCE